MVKHNARLSSAEIGGLWETYYQLTMTLCLIKYFLQSSKDGDIFAILDKTKGIVETNIEEIKNLFTIETIPVPDGFSDKDVNLAAPPLFYEPFSLSFIYFLSRINMINYSFLTCNVARNDCLAFFTKSLNQSSELYTEATGLMLSKGIYDRPPMIPYPDKVEYIHKKSYMAAITGKNRPLNVMELTEIFFNIERNYFSVMLCIALAQVVDDKEIKEYIKDGKKISQKQINFFNGILLKEDLLGTVPTDMEVTTSKVSPFSNKLIMALFTFLNSIDITLIGHALSLSMRVDISANLSKFIGEILLYLGKGFDIMANRDWFEQPPQSADRKELEKN